MKTDRHVKIMELIDNYEISTQEELADALNSYGFHVTQATVSRDIRELKLSKISADGGKTRYAAPVKDSPAMNDKLLRVLAEGFISVDMAQNILVVKTAPGMAMAVCAALDALKWHEIVGSIAGDDTIMCAVRTVDEALIVMNKIKKLINNTGR